MTRKLKWTPRPAGSRWEMMETPTSLMSYCFGDLGLSTNNSMESESEREIKYNQEQRRTTSEILLTLQRWRLEKVVISDGWPREPDQWLVRLKQGRMRHSWGGVKTKWPRWRKDFGCEC